MSKILRVDRYFDNQGNYSGPADYKVIQDGVTWDIFDYADSHGIDLPKHKKHKKQINKDIEVEQNADMGSTHDSGSATEHGDGDSESTE